MEKLNSFITVYQQQAFIFGAVGMETRVKLSGETLPALAPGTFQLLFCTYEIIAHEQILRVSSIQCAF